jgi:hypothetical protein
LKNDPVLTEECSPLLLVPAIENSQNLENAMVDFGVLSHVERLNSGVLVHIFISKSEAVLTEVCSPLLLVCAIENPQNLKNATVDLGVLSRVEKA